MAPDPRDLCTVEDVLAARRDDEASATRQALVQAFVTGASQAVMAWTSRRIRPLDDTPSERFFTAWIARTRTLYVDDLAAAPTAVAIESGDGLTTTPIDLDHIISLPRNRDSWSPIEALMLRAAAVTPAAGETVVVTGRWGWPEIPADVRHATVETAVEWLKANQALTSPSPDQFEPGAPPARALPLIARNLLMPYRRHGIA